MRLFVIGRKKGIKVKRGYIEAYKLYDPDRKETKVVFTEDVVEKAIKRGVQIVGFKKLQRTDVLGNALYNETTGHYNTHELDDIDGEGNALTNKGSLVVLGYRGFDEKREYRTVDVNGVERFISQQEFEEKAAENKMVGARKFDAKYVLYGACSDRLY